MSDYPPPPGPPPGPPGPPGPPSYPPPSFPPPGSGGYQQVGYGYTAGGPQQELAGFWIRFAAAVIDGLLLGVPMSILGAIVGEGGFTAGYGYNPDAAVFLNLLSTVVGVLYYGCLEGGAPGQTIGQRAVGIRVVDADGSAGGPIGVGRGIGRYFARILSSLPCALGYFWMLWDPRKQTWHDKLVRSLVVKVR
jgi:uncharacterized RDD family membrane protein YckC